jgi:hypothetical protein
LEEEVFYGGGKRERDPRRKEKERIDQGKGDLGDQSRRERTSIKEDIGRRRRIFGDERKVFRGSRSSRLLGFVFCLMMMIVVFH